MAKWARRSGGRKRWRWVCEYVPASGEGRGARGEEEEPQPEATIPEVIETPDPFTFDTPEAIVAALWRFEQRKLLAGE